MENKKYKCVNKVFPTSYRKCCAQKRGLKNLKKKLHTWWCHYRTFLNVKILSQFEQNK